METTRTESLMDPKINWHKQGTKKEIKVYWGRWGTVPHGTGVGKNSTGSDRADDHLPVELSSTNWTTRLRFVKSEMVKENTLANAFVLTGCAACELRRTGQPTLTRASVETNGVGRH